MAEDNGQDRTEPATPRRREEARKQGQVALSQDLTGGVILLVGVWLLSLIAPRLAAGLLQVMRADFLNAANLDLTVGQTQVLAQIALLRMSDWLILLFGGLLLASLLTGLVQAGFHITPDLITFKWERLSPAEGIKKFFSLGAVVRTGTSILKIAAVAALVWWVLRGRMPSLAELSSTTVANAAAHGWYLIIHLALAVAAALFLIGVIDYAYQRFKFEQSLRMTRQELKEELKREEGDPLIRARVRRLQREAAQKRMLEHVPKATVVITNPTHFAVALRYTRPDMAAPRITAKGSGRVAERIVELARRHGVPIVERPELARALFRGVPLDRDIPANLYQLVAELLAYLFRLRGRL